MSIFTGILSVVVQHTDNFVMDNVRFYHSIEVSEVVESQGHRIVFIPPVRQDIFAGNTLIKLISAASIHVSEDDCADWIHEATRFASKGGRNISFCEAMNIAGLVNYRSIVASHKTELLLFLGQCMQQLSIYPPIFIMIIVRFHHKTKCVNIWKLVDIQSTFLLHILYNITRSNFYFGKARASFNLECLYLM
ncbi:hypothetical protein RF11_09183 [Thelohanellus kitauei]|uniref:Uncharacterized protein n=1 Tax=Thelohanellus kitauei TaxID=669202 RepID=A0A0C2JP97_THEKT|nr:hypothetical protein RF11_09183 [Thelohanellus kitauei]